MKKTIWYVALLILMGSTAVLADPITITIDNTPLAGGAGSTLTFDATITNNTADVLYLNGDGFDFAQSPPLSVADVTKDFFYSTTWPTTLDPGHTFGSEALFSVLIPAGTPLGSYVAYFDIDGGLGPNDSNLLGTAAFRIDVTPEPGTLSLTLLGMFALAAFGYKRLYA